MEYLVSKKEINRRKKAYLNLSINLIIGVVIGSVIFHFPLIFLNYALIAIILFLIGVFSFVFFRSLAQVKILLSKNTLQRITENQTENYPLAEIKKVVIKWTTNKTIREIYIWLNNGRSIFISALDHFEQFRTNLLNKLDKKVSIQEKHEPLDFDHPLFYSIFGLSVGMIGVLGFKSLFDINYQQMKIGLFVFSGYLVIMGVYFFMTKPISKRSGKTTQYSDYIIAGLMLFLGVIIFLFALND